jgi:hypothetical protein
VIVGRDEQVADLGCGHDPSQDLGAGGHQEAGGRPHRPGQPVAEPGVHRGEPLGLVERHAGGERVGERWGRGDGDSVSEPAVTATRSDSPAASPATRMVMSGRGCVSPLVYGRVASVLDVIKGRSVG